MYMTKWSYNSPCIWIELTPIQFLMELFIDSTGDVVMASNDMEMVFQT